MRHVVWSLVLIGALPGIGGCKSRPDVSGVAAAEVAQPQVIPGFTFVGCRPDEGECYSACTDHKFFPMTKASDFCEDLGDIDGTFECHCFGNGETTDGGSGDAP